VSRASEAIQFKRQLEREGFLVMMSKNNHWTVKSTDGVVVATFGATPSDHRWKQNTRGQIRRWERRSAAREVSPQNTAAVS